MKLPHAIASFMFLPFLASGLPEGITAHQDMLAQEGVCETRWKDLSDTLGIQHYGLDQGIDLWIVPCANWAINVQSTVFLQIPEAAEPSGMLTKSIDFVDYDPYLGLHGTNVIENPEFDEVTKELTSHQYFQSGSECGSAGQFTWAPGPQTYVLKQLIKNDDCHGAGQWVPVYPPSL